MADLAFEDNDITNDANDIRVTDKAGNSKANSIASILLMVWNAIMIFSTIILSFYLLVLKDDSVAPFVVMGVIGLCIPPVVNFIRATIRHNELQKEREEMLEKVQQERIRQARIREWERVKQEKLMAQIEGGE